MVTLASRLAAKLLETECDTRRADTFGEMIEAIHLGSLVIDDIQDSSKVRRGAPALHCQFGVPLALNAGNWLYFSALQALLRAQFHPETERHAIELTLASMTEAHEGQAIDIGINILLVHPEDVANLVETAALKKTGALLEAAFGLGYLSVADRDGNGYAAFRQFGRSWGAALQMLDDLGSFQQSVFGTTAPEKTFEDFRNLRPNFIWMLAGETFYGDDHVIFKSFAKRVSETSIESLKGEVLWGEFHTMVGDSQIFSKGFLLARARVDRAFDDFSAVCSSHRMADEIGQLRKISSDLEAAYGSFKFAKKSKNETDRQPREVLLEVST